MQAEQYGRTNGKRKVLTLKPQNKSSVSKEVPKDSTPTKDKIDGYLLNSLTNKDVRVYMVGGGDKAFRCKVLLFGRYHILVELNDSQKRQRILFKQNIAFIEPIDNSWRHTPADTNNGDDNG